MPRPDGRDAPDWAAKVHVATAPVYYQKYLLGTVVRGPAARIRWTPTWGAGGMGDRESGDYVKRELFMPGARYPWPELVERVTGQPLGVDGARDGRRLAASGVDDGGARRPGRTVDHRFFPLLQRRRHHRQRRHHRRSDPARR